MGLKHLPIGGDNEVIGPHPESISALGFGVREDRDVCSERTGELNTHVTKPTKADNAYFLAWSSTPLFER